MYVVAASPLAKIFIPQYHDELLEHPEKMFDDAPFDVVIPRSSGALKYVYGQPVSVKPLGSEKEEDLPRKYEWLTGGKEGDECNESDCYGIVELPVEQDFTQTFSNLIQKQSKKEDVKSMQRDVQKDLTSAWDKAKIISDKRVKREIWRVFNRFESQRQFNKEAGFGDPKPSQTERLCIYALSEDIKRNKEATKEVDSKLSDAISAIKAATN